MIRHSLDHATRGRICWWYADRAWRLQPTARPVPRAGPASTTWPAAS
jgi:hypothetical protein